MEADTGARKKPLDVDSPSKNMQKKVLMRNANAASLFKCLTTTMQDTVQEWPEKEHAELASSLETHLGEVRQPVFPANQDLVARGIEEVKILLQTAVHMLITRSLEEVTYLLQEEVHGRSESERRLDERCDRLAEAVQAISSEHALQAAQAGSIEEVRSILHWLEDRWDNLDVNVAQVAAQQAAVQPQQGQEIFDTRIADLEERCKHLENAGKAHTEIIEHQKKCLEEHDKVLAARIPSSGVDSADTPEARYDKPNTSLAVLLTDSAQTVSASASSAHERIDSLESIVKDSFERLLQELESVKDCWRLQKAEENSGEVVAVYSPGRPQRLKSESVKQMMSKRRQQEQPDSDVVVMVAPASPTTRVDSVTQPPSEQCRQQAEAQASVIELTCQTARHPSPTGSGSRAWPGSVHSLNATISTSPPVPKAPSSTAGAWSPSHIHQAAPASQLPCRAWPQITSPLSGRRTPSLDARSPMPWPPLPQEQQAQPPARPVGSTTSPATATMIREKSMDARAAPVATPSQPPRATAPTPSTATANAALLPRAASPVRTPHIQSPRELPRETMRACGVRSPSMGPSIDSLVQPARNMRCSLGSASKAVLTQCQPRRSMSGYVL